MFTILKGLPLAYSKDLQEDKELVFRSYDNLSLMLEVMNKMMKEITINKENLRKMTSSHFITATDLADSIVKNLNITFRESYKITSKIVNLAEKLNLSLEDLNLDQVRGIDRRIDNEILDKANIKNSVNSKKSYGGTSFENIKKMINKLKKEIKWKIFYFLQLYFYL